MSHAKLDKTGECESRVIAWSIAISITLGAVGKFVINLAKAYAIIKKLTTRVSTNRHLSYDWS
ncbi:hypothetical protein AYP89_06455 [Lactobacillus crispatus]|nr:hypothetical protein AYP84_09680 [Lactobacillus crispatus]OXC25975.1 hypothetical protein AYP83_06350 [Lactobacillus crispatus]OXC29362.1 hypothetical protein AYP87_02945 [Lactobacillus crispatus]OXC31336.1 hypothetical protein AYP88_03885 [Lactobacillus crispatus]OXC36202.1 hypothetical protein AYP89_06455 [Lactobacillus crispatus]